MADTAKSKGETKIRPQQRGHLQKDDRRRPGVDPLSTTLVWRAASAAENGSFDFARGNQKTPQTTKGGGSEKKKKKPHRSLSPAGYSEAQFRGEVEMQDRRETNLRRGWYLAKRRKFSRGKMSTRRKKRSEKEKPNLGREARSNPGTVSMGVQPKKRKMNRAGKITGKEKSSSEREKNLEGSGGKGTRIDRVWKAK